MNSRDNTKAGNFLVQINTYKPIEINH